MATEQITDDELLALHALANTRGGVKLGSSVLLRLLNTVAALRAQLAERCVVGPDVVTVPREEWDRIADSIEEEVNAIREDWTDPRTNLKYIRGEIEAIRALRSGEVVRWLASHDPEQIHFATLRTAAQRGEG